MITAWPRSARFWQPAEVAAGVAAARQEFRSRRLGEPLARYLAAFDDGRLLAIECKGSNSEINSRKRLNKEAAQNARAWLSGFGGQVVPTVALQGVFKDRQVIEAQDTPMFNFWAHRLDDLCHFIRAAV